MVELAPEVSLRDRVCVVTGASSGIGLETARELAALGATVVLICRDRTRGDAARTSIVESTGNQSIELLLADMASQRQVREAAAQFRATHDRLDILVNNAGAVFPRRELTEDGIERTFAVNHLGYFLLTTLLLDLIEASAPARIVNVASGAHRRARLDFDDLGGDRSRGAMSAYGRSKLANVMFSYELSRRLEGSGVTVNAIHPGLVATNFGSSVRWARWLTRPIRRFMTQPDEAGAAVVRLAAAPDLEGVSGRYYSKWDEERSSDVSYDLQAQRRLWSASEALVAGSA